MNSTTNTRSGDLAMSWVAVTDVRGRARLEVRWVQAPQTQAPQTQAPHAATHAA